MIHEQRSLKFITVKFRHLFRVSINMQSQGLSGYRPESGATLLDNPEECKSIIAQVPGGGTPRKCLILKT